MTRIVAPFALLTTTTLALALPAQAAGLTRTFVSAAGSDSNPCTITQPCATLAHAFSLTAATGIIAALDPGKYGPLTINKAITINGNGWAAITAPASGNGITVSAGASDAVELIGLEIDGAGTATDGIQFNSGVSLTIENCIVRNVAQNGLEIPSTSGTTFAVSHSSFNNNNVAISISAVSTAVTGAIDQTEFYGNQQALGMGGTAGANIVVKDSVAANNGSIGFDVSSSSAPANLSLMHVVVTGSFTALQSTGSTATILLAESNIMGNTTAWFIGQSGTIKTYGDNYFAANGSNTGSLTSITRQ